MGIVRFCVGCGLGLSLLSCKEPEPVATGTKRRPPVEAQPSNPPSTTPSSPGTGTAGGNAAAGATLLRGSCETAGCHATGSALALQKADAAAFGDAAQVTEISGRGVHAGVRDAIRNQAADIKAALEARP